MRLVAAPLVEGAVAASINAGGGGSLDEVAAEAAGALRSKQAELGDDGGTAAVGRGRRPRDAETELPVRNRLGLHARPAAKLVEIATRPRRELLLSNATTGRGPATARSLTEIALLGVRGGHTLKVQASGPARTRSSRRSVRWPTRASGMVWTLRSRPRRPRRPPAPSDESRCPPSRPAPDTRAAGHPASPGLADGPLRRHRRRAGHPEGDADDPEAEAAALDDALAPVREELAAARDDLVDRGRADEAAIFEAQGALPATTRCSGRPARRDRRPAPATPRAPSTTPPRTSPPATRALDDPYLRERAADVRDVGRRVIRAAARRDDLRGRRR